MEEKKDEKFEVTELELHDLDDVAGGNGTCGDGCSGNDTCGDGCSGNDTCGSGCSMPEEMD